MSSSTAISPTNQSHCPVELLIHNYPSSTLPSLETIKSIAYDRLTIAQSTINSDLLNILDGMRYKHINIEDCTLKPVALEILGRSAEETLFIRCTILESFKKPKTGVTLDDFGIARLDDDFVPFQPSLRNLRQTQSCLPEEILSIDLQEQDQEYENHQKKLKTIFEKLTQSTNKLIKKYDDKLKFSELSKKTDLSILKSLHGGIGETLYLIAKSYNQLNDKIENAKQSGFQFNTSFLETFENDKREFESQLLEYDAFCFLFGY